MQALAVIGAGVSGLTTAVSLVRLGYSVTIYAKELSEQTTSGTAAAFWYPYMAYPQDKVARWAQKALRNLKSSPPKVIPA